MDPIKTGQLIRQFRMQLGLTQRELAEMLRGHLGAAPAVVNSDVFLVFLVVDVVKVKLLAHVHAAYCRARDKTDFWNQLRRDFCVFKSLV